MAERLDRSKGINGLKGHHTTGMYIRQFNCVRQASSHDNYDKDEVLELQNTLSDRRGISVNEFYIHLEELLQRREGEKVMKLKKEKRESKLDDRIELINEKINEFFSAASPHLYDGLAV